MSSPTQRSLKYFREQGYLCAIVERWNPYAKVRIDLFGMFDILAIGTDKIVGTQTTTSAHIKERLEKIRDNPAYPAWKQCGGLVVVHGWAKTGKRGKRKTWTVEEIWI